MRLLRTNFFTISLFSILGVLTLIGCQRYATYVPIEEKTFQLPSRVRGSSDKTVIRMMTHFQRGGVVKVATIGQNYLVSFPSSAVFAEQSPRVKWEGYRLLNQIVAFMRQFRKIAVNVTSYSSQYKSVRREQALTLTRARVVADYLWHQGIDSRLIFSEGAASDKPITIFRDGEDDEYSSRIEITFRDAII